MSTESRTFSAALTGLLNDYGIEASSDTPDFILENFVTSCLAAFTVAARTRDQWHGFRPFGGERGEREAAQARDWLSRKGAELGSDPDARAARFLGRLEATGHEITPDPEDGTDQERKIERLADEAEAVTYHLPPPAGTSGGLPCWCGQAHTRAAAGALNAALSAAYQAGRQHGAS